MESVMVGQARVASTADGLAYARQQIPLSFMRAGEEARVIKVRGNDDMHHHLENLGFVPGASFRVVSEHGSSFIVEIKGSQIALDKTAASKVIAG